MIIIVRFHIYVEQFYASCGVHYVSSETVCTIQGCRRSLSAHLGTRHDGAREWKVRGLSRHRKYIGGYAQTHAEAVHAPRLLLLRCPFNISRVWQRCRGSAVRLGNRPSKAVLLRGKDMEARSRVGNSKEW